jgi:ABC-type transporter MlaC component
MQHLTRPTSLLTALLALVCVASFASSASAQTDTPEETIRSFYKWYVEAMMENEDPLEDDRATLKQFATTRLIAEIDKMRKGPDGVSGDYFLDAQDFDKDWAKNIKVGKPNIEGDKASVAVELRGSELGKKNLKVTLKQDGDAWKVDKVAGQ